MSRSPQCEVCEREISSTRPYCMCDKLSILKLKGEAKGFAPYARSEAKKIYVARSAFSYRERKGKAEGYYTSENIERIYNLQNKQCYYCKDSIQHGYEIDHLKPLIQGGTEWPDNISLACKKCNQRKWGFSERKFWKILEASFGVEVVNERKVFAKSYKNEKYKMAELRKYASSPCDS